MTTSDERVALYMRVSTEDQAERQTIEAQRHFLRGFVNLYGLDVTGEYADDGVIGTIPLHKRVGGMQLLEDAHGGRFGTVIVHRVDRLGRSLMTLLDAYTTLDKIGVTIRSATEPFDTASHIGRFLFQLLGSLAELDRATTVEKLTQGRDRVIRDSGRWTAGPVPIGYDLDEAGCLIPSMRIVPQLEITEAELVRTIFERMAAGGTAIEQSRWLNALDIPTSRPYALNRNSGKTVRARTKGVEWIPVRILKILRNPLYIGRPVFRSSHGHIERCDASLALVDEGLWQRAQAQLKRNQSRPKGNQKRDNLLRNLISCGGCGCKFVGGPKYNQKGRAGYYYRCGGQMSSVHPDNGKKCKAKLIEATWLESFVWQDCREFILNPGAALAEAKKQLEGRVLLEDQLERERRALQQALAQKAEEREQVMVLFRKKRITLVEAETQLDQVEKEAVDLRTTLRGLESQQELTQTFAEHYQEAEELLVRLRDRLGDIEAKDDFAAKRQVVELLVTDIVVDTHGEGSRKHATVTVSYAFTPSRVVEKNSTVSGTTRIIC